MTSSQAQAPMLHVPKRTTDDVDWETGLQKYIRETYQEDPGAYAGEIALLHRYRQDARGAGNDVTGRDILYRYYGQLDLLDIRFPIDEAHVKVLFRWYDAFSQAAVAQYSVAYEKASVIFNLAAVCSSIAALQNRFDDAGLKTACKYFQIAAGYFQFINDNFLHPPSVDMSRESVQALIELALAQAQECFVEKVVADQKSASLLSKLAASAAHAYSTARDMLGNSAIAGQFPPEWREMVACKAVQFEALAHAEFARALAEEQRFGREIAHLQTADSLAKQASKLAAAFATAHASWTPFAASAASGSSSAKVATTGAAGALAVNCRALAARVAESLKQAVKDNEFIYHEDVPSLETLPPVDKLCAVKPLSLADACANGDADLARIVGPDAFARLIPLAVHQAASVYSEQRDARLRTYSDSCEKLDTSSIALRSELGIDQALAIAERGSLATLDQDVPVAATQWAAQVRSEESSGATANLVAKLDAEAGECVRRLDAIASVLDAEQLRSESLRREHGDAWTLEPAAGPCAPIVRQIKTLRAALAEARATDATVREHYSNVESFVRVFGGPAAQLGARMRAQLQDGHSSSGTTPSLLDDAPGSTVSAEVPRVREITARLDELQQERKATLAAAKQRAQSDDICGALLQKRTPEKRVIERELAKYDQDWAVLDANFKQHVALEAELRTAVRALETAVPAVRAALQSRKAMAGALDAWKDAQGAYSALRRSLRNGLRFYSDLAGRADAVRGEADAIVAGREASSRDLVAKIQDRTAAQTREALQARLGALDLGRSTSGPPAPAFSASAPSAPPPNPAVPAFAIPSDWGASSFNAAGQPGAVPPSSVASSAYLAGGYAAGAGYSSAGAFGSGQPATGASYLPAGTLGSVQPAGGHVLADSLGYSRGPPAPTGTFTPAYSGQAALPQGNYQSTAGASWAPNPSMPPAFNLSGGGTNPPLYTGAGYPQSSGGWGGPSLNYAANLSSAPATLPASLPGSQPGPSFLPPAQALAPPPALPPKTLSDPSERRNSLLD